MEQQVKTKISNTIIIIIIIYNVYAGSLFGLQAPKMHFTHMNFFYIKKVFCCIQLSVLPSPISFPCSTKILEAK